MNPNSNIPAGEFHSEMPQAREQAARYAVDYAIDHQIFDPALLRLIEASRYALLYAEGCAAPDPDPFAPTDWRLLAAQADLILQARGQNLGAFAGAALRISNDYAEAYHMDSAFDGGEFSGPALARAEVQAMQALCAAYGLSPMQAYAAICERTTHKWAYFNGIMAQAMYGEA